jgi:hypothetical protein
MTERPDPLNHLFGKRREREVWTKISPRPVDNLCLFEPSRLILVKFFAPIFHCGNLLKSDPRDIKFTASPEQMDGLQSLGEGIPALGLRSGAVDSKGGAALLWGEGVIENGLCHELQPTTADALHDSKEQQ